jgi:hypothetical protein
MSLHALTVPVHESLPAALRRCAHARLMSFRAQQTAALDISSSFGAQLTGDVRRTT